MANKHELWHYISNLAVDSLLAEAYLSPKPGLVDAFDNGSHKDMDIELLAKSAKSFYNGFYNYLICGYEHTGSENELMQKIRIVGMACEQAMFEHTEKINTHKGANFSFGIVLSALGFYIAQNKIMNSKAINYGVITYVFVSIKKMTERLVETDFAHVQSKKQLTHGEMLYINHHFTGIRGEAQSGYPTIMDLALPKLLSLRDTSKAEDEIYLVVLFTLMSVVDDTNIVARGGFDSLSYVKKTAIDFLQSYENTAFDYKQSIEKINEDFKTKNLSPGGSADLLALTIFIGKLIE